MTLSSPRTSGLAFPARRAARLRRGRSAFERSRLQIVHKLASLIESADRYTFGHCQRVAAYALDVARTLGLDERQRATVYVGAYLHDIGKVLVPREILTKPGQLAAGELDVIRTHPQRGLELLGATGLPWNVAPIIRWHHERYDGSGYPDHLCGTEIPLEAQIIGVVDAFDALTSTRTYRPAIAPARALAVLQLARRGWHPEVFRAFVSAFNRVNTLVA
ncbi:MAG TPA: HD-GYP domain-containing protein [Gemmatimonadales bacterium]|nr:HD-GYP domain-containing protein [Gemmatimonadales bacterium]